MGVKSESSEDCSIPPSSPGTDYLIEHQRFYFDDGNVVFQVEGVLYNVHRYHFRDSKTFQQLLFNAATNGGAGGPIALELVRRADWERFLSLLYPRQLLGQHDLQTAEEWLSVVRFAADWGFLQLHEIALERVQAVATPVDRIVLAREHNMRGLLRADAARWELVSRNEPLTLAEGNRLGMEEAILIATMREERRMGNTPVNPIDVDRLDVKKEEPH
ncbi:hypothetical protein WOLCODRAFT_107779 [Wolfiporia cocos MD-104 SS10]|uniref:BTB domain-containing protein n=1 Tax=Wolfiporia cocos (strain MD-104) TaxID=742152 RepID=A0A2H3JIB8_WOLCO|nr:hypothetical protein WOLCODRAFT_107779 [Wolfiporia cocos MD-104 SS10]